MDLASSRGVLNMHERERSKRLSDQLERFQRHMLEEDLSVIA